MNLRALFAISTSAFVLTAALTAPVVAQYQQPQQQPQSQTERQDPAAEPQQDTQRQGTTSDQRTTGTTGQFGADQQDLPATASPLPLLALAGLASLAGAWAVRRFRL
jgi:hypothetical protein